MRTLLRLLRDPWWSSLRRASGGMEGPFNFVAGRRTTPRHPSGQPLLNLNPATGRALCRVAPSGAEDVDEAVRGAREAFPGWAARSPRDRGRILCAAAHAVRRRLEEIARVEVSDTGKPLWEARVDISGCADVLEYYGGIAATLRGSHHALEGGSFAVVHREPLGVVAGIGAWNYPFQVMTWKVAPALACGNTCVYKPSELTPLSSVMLAEILSEAGLPSGVINVLQGGRETGEWLCSHSDVAKVTFTGSVPTGRAVLRGCANGIRGATLELGGKSALLVFDDCDLIDAIKATLLGNFLTQGEVCTNCTRVYIQQGIFSKFVDKLVSCTARLKVGDPLDEETTVGAVISESHGKKILDFVESARQEGAKVACGGKRVYLEGGLDGCFVSPCVLTECTDVMRAVREEIFGPVVCLLPFESEEEAVAKANDTSYGLAAGVMTRDLCRANRVASALQAGIVWINNYNVFPPEVPFGGYKHSGMGRENGLAALDDFTQLKTVYIEMNAPIECPLYKDSDG